MDAGEELGSLTVGSRVARFSGSMLKYYQQGEMGTQEHARC